VITLTTTQTGLLASIVAEVATRYDTQAATEPRSNISDYWLAEAAQARQLAAILGDALTVTVESVRLTPPAPADSRSDLVWAVNNAPPNR